MSEEQKMSGVVMERKVTGGRTWEGRRGERGGRGVPPLFILQFNHCIYAVSVAIFHANLSEMQFVFDGLPPLVQNRT